MGGGWFFLPVINGYMRGIWLWGLLFICSLLTLWIVPLFFIKKKSRAEQQNIIKFNTKAEVKREEERKNRPIHLFLPYCLKYLKPFFLHRMEAPVLKHALLPLNLLLRSAEKRNGLAQTCDCRRTARVLCSKRHPNSPLGGSLVNRKWNTCSFCRWGSHILLILQRIISSLWMRQTGFQIVS